MLRWVLGTVAVVAFLVSGPIATGGDKKADKNQATTGSTKAGKGKKQQATITKVDAKKGLIWVKMKNKEGKQVEKKFQLTEDVRMLDSRGNVAVLDVFRSGDEVLFIEAEGRLRELHKSGKKGNTGRNNDKTSGSK
jgi:hypothetical protein